MPKGMRKLYEPDIVEQFWTLVDKNTGIHGIFGECWHWTGSIGKDGYGTFSACSAKASAHRLAFRLDRGYHPPFPMLDHLCHSSLGQGGCRGGRDCKHRRCVNPDHLEPVTGAENSRRTGQRGRVFANCINGHPWLANTMFNVQGFRECRDCLEGLY